MPYTLTISTDGAAFEDDPAAELARILRQLAGRLEDGRIGADETTMLHDHNGNNVGAAQVVEVDPAEVLDAIAAQLTGREWDAEDIEHVAAKVTATGRTISEPTFEDFWLDGAIGS